MSSRHGPCVVVDHNLLLNGYSEHSQIETSFYDQDYKANGHHMSNGDHVSNGVANGHCGKKEPHQNGVTTTRCNNNIKTESHKFITCAELDAVSKADSYTTIKPDGVVQLRMTEHGYGSEKPRTIPSQFRDTVDRVGDSIAMAVKRNNEWVHWTWHQYHTDVMKAAKSFIKLGLDPFHAVGILGFNSPEWFISDLGAIFAGGLALGFYTTSTPDALQFVAHDARCNIIVVENNMQLQKILKVRKDLPHLKAIIQYTGELEDSYPGVITWEEFMRYGKDVSDSEVDARLRLIAPNKCATLIYTSGTTGQPKGVMMSHDNLTWTAMQGVHSMETLVYGKEVGVSYLPLSHVAAQILDIYISISVGAAIYFAQPDALKGSLVETLKEVRPTSFLGVPRVWEKIQEKMLAVGRQNTGLKKKIGAWAKDVGLRGSYAKMKGQILNGHANNSESLPWNFGLANSLVFKKIKVALGLDRCNIFMTAAAPMMKSTLDYFMSLNIPIFEIYGMSECSGPHTISCPSKYLITSAGPGMTGVQTKLAGQDDEGNGEVCMYGRHVMMGYLNQQKKTDDTIDSDGYLHSEDIGRVDKNGFLFITGRIKEILITAGGENIAPIPIEDNVKEALPCVSNCMLIGDKRKFLSLLISLKTEVDPEGTPLDALHVDTINFCKDIGVEAKTLSDLQETKNTTFMAAIQKGIDAANKKAVSNAARVAKWTLLPQDFSIPGGELGPTLKVRRPIVTKMYSDVISNLYEDSS